MKKSFARLLLLILVVTTFIGIQPAALAAAKPSLPKDIDFAYKTGRDASNSYGMVIQNFTKKTKVKNLKSSNPSVLKVSWNKKMGDCIDCECLKPGKATISCVLYNGTKKVGTFRVKATVYKYKSPVNSFKLGSMNYANKFKNNDQYYLNLRKAKKLKVSIKPLSGWKLDFIEFYNGTELENINNNTVVYFNSDWSYVNVFFSNAKLNRSESVCIYVIVGD